MVANDAHLHILLNHFPIIGAMIATLLLAYALALRNAAVTRAALILAVLVALVTIPVKESGEDAEEIVERMPGASEELEDLIEAHEEQAERAAIVMWVTGGFAFLGLIASRRGDVPKWVSGGALALLLVSSGLMAWTGNAGGQISHPEARPDFVAPAGGAGGHDHDSHD